MLLRSPVQLVVVLLSLTAAFIPLDPARADSSPPGPGAAPEVQLSIDTPQPHALVGGPSALAFLSGRALAFDIGTQGLDLILAIDTSDSTDERFFEAGSVAVRPRGLWVGLRDVLAQRRQAPPEETLLGAQIRIAQELLARLDPRTTRVGVVSYAGDWDPEIPDSRTEVGLTADFDQVRRGLARIQRRGSWGPTNLVAGLMRGLSELLATTSAQASPRAEVRRVVVILGDWTGLRPFRANPSAATELGALRVSYAQRARVRVDSVVVGEEARRPLTAALRLAAATRGCVTRVASPADLEALFDEFDYTEVELIQVRNRSLDSPWSTVVRSADGGFATLVPLEEGLNHLQVSARSKNGTVVTRQVDVRYAPSQGRQPIPPRYLALHNRLLEGHLRQLYAGRPAGEGRRRLEVQVTPDAETSTQFPASPARHD